MLEDGYMHAWRPLTCTAGVVGAEGNDVRVELSSNVFGRPVWGPHAGHARASEQGDQIETGGQASACERQAREGVCGEGAE